jgi:hypothetical protein
MSMRTIIAFAFAAALIAAPAAAQNTDDANATVATNDAATTTTTVDNGSAYDPALNASLPPATGDPMAPAPSEQAPARKSGGGGFPWGILGLVGLVGLFGRRS